MTNLQNNTRIQIQGLVQGVGFRPLVFRLAKKHHVKGIIRNDLSGLIIDSNLNRSNAEKFVSHIIAQKPQMSSIEKVLISEIENHLFEDISISKSLNLGLAKLIIPPDFGICDSCKKEIFEQNNRRKGYAFTTCTDCGPRISILNNLPFDRENTSMHEFVMCENCHAEYQKSEDKRFFSQTNSCPECGIKLKAYTKGICFSEHQSQIINLICEEILSNNIVAIKSIGGYVLLANAQSEIAVNKLRFRKKRPNKPFAVIFNSLKEVNRHVNISETEINELISSSNPIVIAKQKFDSNISKAVNPNNSNLGVFTAYSPLLCLICERLKIPLVATSANESGQPIVSKDILAIDSLNSIADLIVTNNREITIPQDDAVMKFSKMYGKKVIIRRGRGLEIINRLNEIPKRIAFGADLKNTFSISSGQNSLTSYYLGDLNAYDSQLNFEQMLNHFLKLQGIKTLNGFEIQIDKHPNYFSSKLGREFAERNMVKINEIQHHEAHFVAVLAENNLLNQEFPVLGVIWDGTGYGNDDQIWGGEFFEYSDQKINRINHLGYFDAFLNDKMAKEPRLSALTLLANYSEFEDTFIEKFSSQELSLYKKLISANTLKTSSMGRLFDSVASILNLCDYQTFEGEAAQMLENEAQKFFDERTYDFNDFYQIEELDTYQLISEIVKDIKINKEVSYIAAKFHNTLIEIIEKQAKNHLHVAFSGGVFQNTLLIDLIINKLSNKFQLYFHKKHSPNDECVSLGQLYYP